LSASALVGCVGDGSEDIGVAAGIYAEVVRRVVGDGTVDDPPLVFVRPVPGHHIDLGVQAEVIRRLDKVAVVRFVDEDDEVLLIGEPNEPVRDGAMVVTVGDIDRSGSRAEVVAERYVDRRHAKSECVALRRVGDTWEVLAEGCLPPA
jgi:hypothetical protein